MVKHARAGLEPDVEFRQPAQSLRESIGPNRYEAAQLRRWDPSTPTNRKRAGRGVFLAELAKKPQGQPREIKKVNGETRRDRQ
jgi:hypothetical protein